MRHVTEKQTCTVLTWSDESLLVKLRLRSVAVDINWPGHVKSLAGGGVGKSASHASASEALPSTTHRYRARPLASKPSSVITAACSAAACC